MGSPLTTTTVYTVSMAPGQTNMQHVDGSGLFVADVELPVVSTVDEGVGFSPIIKIVDIPGCIEIFSSIGNITPTSVALTPPFLIDWRIYLGSGRCQQPVYDDAAEPVFGASTIVKGAPGLQAGMLCEIGASASDSCLVCARVSGIVGATAGSGPLFKISLFLRCLPGLPGPVRAAQAGSFIG